MPNPADAQTGQFVYGRTFAAIAAGSNYLAGNAGLRLINGLARRIPIKDNTPANRNALFVETAQADETVHLPLPAPQLSTAYMVALAYYGVVEDAVFSCELRHTPAINNTVAVPGSGNLIDPGFQLSQSLGYIPAVQFNEFRWLYCGTRRVAPDPQAAQDTNPRALCNPNKSTAEIVFSWQDLLVSALAVFEIGNV